MTKRGTAERIKTRRIGESWLEGMLVVYGDWTRYWLMVPKLAIQFLVLHYINLAKMKVFVWFPRRNFWRSWGSVSYKTLFAQAEVVLHYHIRTELLASRS